MRLPKIKKNDSLAKILIFTVSIIVFVVVAVLGRKTVEPEWPFGDMSVYSFAKMNAVINSFVFLLLLIGLWSARSRKLVLHSRVMLAAILLSVLFLVSYIMHHLFAGDTNFGGEGFVRYFYYFILITHIILAGIILPFILFTAYRALTGEYAQHRKLARWTWPLWAYVSLTGVIIYLMISPYYA